MSNPMKIKNNNSMKKIIQSILLTASTSCNLLFAQAAIREQVKDTSQITDYRLQSKNRFKETEIQTTDNRKTELSSEDQIGQGAQTTTNYELRTANYNDQGNDLDCYLMMDPEELKKIEEGIEDLKGGCGSSEKTASLSKTAVVTTGVARSAIVNNLQELTNVVPLMTKAECERLQREARAKATEATESARRARKQMLEATESASRIKAEISEATERVRQARAQAEEDHQKAEVAHKAQRKCWLTSSKDAERDKAEALERSIVAKKAEAETLGQSVTTKKAEAETLEKSVTGKKVEAESWEKASTAATKVSNYWGKALESLAQGNGRDTNLWIIKANAAETKVLAAQPCGDSWSDKRNRADEVMTMIRNKVWPCVSEAMKAFIAHPSEARMLDASASVYIYASASASASASAYAYAYASASASAYAYAYAYAATASKFFAESSAEAVDSAKIFKTLETRNNGVLDLLNNYPNWFSDAGIENITWSVQSARETAAFEHAVVAFKREQEAGFPALKKPMEAAQEQNRRIEQGKLAEIKALAGSPCGDTYSP